MELKEILSGRIRDLSHRAWQSDVPAHTSFLSSSEQALFYEILRKEYHITSDSGLINGVPFLLYGGKTDSDRSAAFFLPSWQDPETFLQEERDNASYISSIHILPAASAGHETQNPTDYQESASLTEKRNESPGKFSEALGHRDYLGAVMNLGIERNRIGDILTRGEEAFIFVLTEVAPTLCNELSRVRHTPVRCEIVPPSRCTLEPEYVQITGSVASERLDAVLAMAYRLSRGKAQELLSSDRVFVNGRTVHNCSYIPKPGERVSVRGLGKFIYEGAGGTSRKGRLFVSIKAFR